MAREQTMASAIRLALHNVKAAEEDVRLAIARKDEAQANLDRILDKLERRDVTYHEPPGQTDFQNALKASFAALNSDTRTGLGEYAPQSGLVSKTLPSPVSTAVRPKRAPTSAEMASRSLRDDKPND